MHKQIAESKNLADQAQELANFLTANEEFFEPKIIRLHRRDKTPGGYRIPIEKHNRAAAQKSYRAKVKCQVQMATADLEKDVIIEDISYCEMQYWRW